MELHSIIKIREVWLGCQEFSCHWPHGICCNCCISICCTVSCYYSHWRSELYVTRIVCNRNCWYFRESVKEESRMKTVDNSIDCLLMVYLRKHCYVVLIKQNSLASIGNNNWKVYVFTFVLTLFTFKQKD